MTIVISIFSSTNTSRTITRDINKALGQILGDLLMVDLPACTPPLRDIEHADHGMCHATML